MVKRMILVYKRPDMTGDEFRRYYIETHGPIVARMPGLRRYVQNPILPDADGREPELSGIAEVWYESEDAMHQALSSPAGAGASESLARFVDVARTLILPVQECPVL